VRFIKILFPDAKKENQSFSCIRTKKSKKKRNRLLKQTIPF